jgi:hypothetical protein
MSQTSPDPATAGPGSVSQQYVEDVAAAPHLGEGILHELSVYLGFHY